MNFYNRTLLIIFFTVGCFTAGCHPRRTETASGYKKQMKHVDVTVENELAAMEEGLRYLIRTQNKSGSWGIINEVDPWKLYVGSVASYKVFEAASTALCCMALMEAQEIGLDVGTALPRGLRYLLDIRPSRRSSGGELYSVWALGFVSQCLARASYRDDVGASREEVLLALQSWVEQMERQQAAEGGWSYYDSGFQHPTGFSSTSFTTSTILLAALEARAAGAKVSEKLIGPPMRSIRRMRLPNKTYAYGVYAMDSPMFSANQVKGSLGRAQGPNLALYLSNGGVTVEDMMLGLDRLFEHHLFIEIGRGRPYPHEAWFATAGYYYLYGHFYAAEVIRHLPDEKQAPYWRQLSQAMLNSQQQDGSWFDFALYGYHKAYGSGFGLYTLIQCYKNRR